MRFIARATLALSICSLSAPASAQDSLFADVQGDLVLEPVVGNLNGPTSAEFLPDGRMVIIEQFGGTVYVWNGAGAAQSVGSFNVQSSSERGLLGLAIDPDFATSNRIYFYLSSGGAQQVRWATLNGNTLDTANATTILSGMAANRNHNGGGIKFGPDGYLYIGVGDTGCNCGCAPGTNTNNYFGTCLSQLHGKVLRIDRDGGIPASNPLVNVAMTAACGTGTACSGGANQAPTQMAPPRTEIYNWGFRNPWRFSFDEQTGFLWVGDVGEVTWEEINVSTGPGIHHGWPWREGEAGQARTQCSAVTPSGDCNEPAYAYRRNDLGVNGASITGGVFANHCSWPAPWSGRYFFGDYVKNRVWSLTPNAARDGVTGGRIDVARAPSGVVHFFNGPDGAVYYVGANGGTINRIRPANPAICPDADGGVPDTGVEPDSGVVPDAGEAADANDPADAGAGADAAPRPDATPTADSGVVNPPADSGVVPGTPDAGVVPVDEDGCGCTATPSEGPLGSTAWMLGVALLLGSRRRRR